jgi:RNA polymerase sigma factor (sigma-70 family)
MDGDTTARLQPLLDRHRAGDDTARGELLAYTYERLGRIARRMFRRDFIRLRKAHESGSVAQEAVIRLQQALEKVHPATGADYYRWAAHVIRRVLLEMCRQLDRRPATVPLDQGPDADASAFLTLVENPAAQTDLDPARLAMWTKFHQKVRELPDEEQAVVDCLWYHGLSKTEAAKVLNVPRWKVHRLWVEVREKLAPYLPGADAAGGAADSSP